MTSSTTPADDQRPPHPPTPAAVVRAAVVYFAPIFALGWLLGPLRVLVAAPRWGPVRASAAEAAIMAGAIYASARTTVTRLGPRSSLRPSAYVGALAFAMVAVLEIGGARVVRRRTLRAYLATFVSPSGVMSAATFSWFAVAPLVVAAAVRDAVSTRASSEERDTALAGDECIANPIGSMTHAITIDAPRGHVWPWLIQMGAGRAGWYSYDALDNGGRASAKRIIAEFQSLAVGDTLPWKPGGSTGFRVLRADVARCLALGWCASDGAPLVTWAFVLEDAARAQTSRLCVRVRTSSRMSYFGIGSVVGRLFMPTVHEIMQRKQLLTIAERVTNRAETGAFTPVD